jgi:glucose/arabinose dehydrogenase
MIEMAKSSEYLNRPEIWALGMRNPWRFSFDTATGDLYIADVAQSTWEEINFQPAASKGGENYGWNAYEGAHTYPPNAPVPADASKYTLPIAEYGREAGQSVSGGFVYRGTAIKALRGVYVYADYGTGTIWGLARINGTWKTAELLDTSMNIASFGQDEDGEMYVLDLAAGTISAVVP